MAVRPIDPFALVGTGADSVWVLKPSRKEMVLTTSGTGECRFWRTDQTRTDRITATKSFSRAGRLRFVLPAPPPGESAIVATQCVDGSSQITVHRPLRGQYAKRRNNQLEAVWQGLSALSRLAAQRDRAGRYAEAADLRMREGTLASLHGWRGYDSARFMLSGVLSYRAGELATAERRLNHAQTHLPSWATLQRARLSRFRGYIASERQQHRQALSHFRDAIRWAEFYGHSGQVGLEMFGLATELSIQGRDREALASLAEVHELYRGQTKITTQLYSNDAMIRATAHTRNAGLTKVSRIRAAFETAWRKYQARNAAPPRLAWVSAEAAAFEQAIGNVSAARAWLDRVPESVVAELTRERWRRRSIDAAIGAAESRITISTLELWEREAAEILGTSSEIRGALALSAGLVAYNQGAFSAAERALRRGLAVVATRAARLETASNLGGLVQRQHSAIALLADIMLRTGRPNEAWSLVEKTFADVPRSTQSVDALGSESAEWRSFTEARARLRRAEGEWCAALARADEYRCRLRQRQARARLREAQDTLNRAARAKPNEPRPLAEVVDVLHPREALIYGLRSAQVDEDPWLLLVDRTGVIGAWRGHKALLSETSILKGVGRIYVVGTVPIRQIAAQLALDVQWSRLSFGGELLGRRPDRNGPTLAVVDPDSTLLPVREPTRRTHSGPNVQWLIGPQATIAAVTSALAKAVRFHFVGHGVGGGSGPMTTFLKLFDGAMTREDVLRLPSVPRIVILEGCETGSLDGVSGLPQAFIARGAWAVLATRRMLQTGESSAFVRRFIEAGGWSRPGRAFSRAVRKSREAGDTSHSAFVLWGPLPSLGDDTPR